MSILDYTFNLIREVQNQQKEEAPPPPESEGEEAPPPKQQEKELPKKVKVPSNIKSFVSRMVKNFGPEGSASLDMKFMRKARETLGIPGAEVSKIIEKIKDGGELEEILSSIKPNTDKF